MTTTDKVHADRASLNRWMAKTACLSALWICSALLAGFVLEGIHTGRLPVGW